MKIFIFKLSFGYQVEWGPSHAYKTCMRSYVQIHNAPVVVKLCASTGVKISSRVCTLIPLPKSLKPSTPDDIALLSRASQRRHCPCVQERGSGCSSCFIILVITLISSCPLIHQQVTHFSSLCSIPFTSPDLVLFQTI